MEKNELIYLGMTMLFILVMFIFLAWLAKYWDVFEDEEKRKSDHDSN